MEWQQTISLLIVGLAAAALVWGRLRRRKKGVCLDTHCGCADSAPSSPQNSIVFHARKGQRAQVRLKMK